MKTYHKIQTLFLRSPESNFKQIMVGQWAKPEFELLKDLQWRWDEKIDGTNIRIIWDGSNVTFAGKTDEAQLPAHLFSVLQILFPAEKLFAVFGDTPVCLYGEGYGVKIQKGGNYLPDRVSFILFDCLIGRFYLTRDSLEDIAGKLGIDIMPIVGHGSLDEAVEFVRSGYKSRIAHNKNYEAEGIILRPPLELYNRAGERIIAKLKAKDFTPILRPVKQANGITI